MKDIGLGILDPYTVVTVLATLVLSRLLFGYEIPLDTTNGTQLIISLVLFTGYFYAARSLFRLPAAIVRAYFNIGDVGRYLKRLNPFVAIRHFKDILYWLRSVVQVILEFPIYILYLLFLVADFSEGAYGKNNRSLYLFRFEKRIGLQLFLKLLDRASVILFAFLATVPSFQRYLTSLALFGIIAMTLVYLFKGNFSALIQDELTKREPQKKKVDEQPKGREDEWKLPANHIKVIRWGNVPLEASPCLVCGKICTANAEGKFPKVCSHECFQKWVHAWDKDWCIGEGEERTLIEQMRSNHYQSTAIVELAIARLRALENVNALWALMAVIRDGSVCMETPLMSIQQSTQWAYAELEAFAKSQNFSVDVFNACIFDETPEVIHAAADMISRFIPVGKVQDFRVEQLFRSQELDVRLSATKILGKAQNTTELLKQLGQGVDVPFEDRAILDALSNMEPEMAVRALKKAQAHKVYWIREEASELLRNKFEMDVPEPEQAEDYIQCIHCGHQFKINIPKNRDTLVFMPTLKRRLFSRPPMRFISCPSCRNTLAILLTQNMPAKRRSDRQREIIEEEAPFLTATSILDRGINV